MSKNRIANSKKGISLYAVEICVVRYDRLDG